MSFYDDSDVTVALFADGSAQPQYTTTVPAGEKSGGKYTAVYDIPEVAPGTYTMKVMKQNHVTREYTVTVGAENVTQDVTLYLIGDVNMDGETDTKDLIRLMKYLAGAPVSVSHPDMNGDENVDTRDMIRLMKLLAER